MTPLVLAPRGMLLARPLGSTGTEALKLGRLVD